jgi:hypothetical protein
MWSRERAVAATGAAAASATATVTGAASDTATVTVTATDTDTASATDADADADAEGTRITGLLVAFGAQHRLVSTVMMGDEGGDDRAAQASGGLLRHRSPAFEV